MEQSQINEHRRQYREHLLQKSSNKIIQLFLVVLCLYIFSGICLLHYHMLEVYWQEEVQIKYDQSLLKTYIQHKFDERILFLNTAREIFNVNTTYSTNEICNPTQYNCQDSTRNLYYKLHPYHSLIRASMQNLPNLQQETLIILSSGSKLIYNTSIQTEQINAITAYLSLNESKDNGYIIQSIKTKKDKYYDIFCGMIQSFITGKICLISSQMLFSFPGTDSYLKKAVTGAIFTNIGIVDIKNSRRLNNHIEQIYQDIKSKLITSHHKPTISETYLKQCLRMKTETLEQIENQQLECFHNQYLHILGYPSILGKVQVQTSYAYYKDAFNVQEIVSGQQYAYYLTPSVNYYQLQQESLQKFFNHFKITVTFSILILCIWIVLLGFSQKNVDYTIIQPINFVAKLADIVSKNSIKQNIAKQFETIVQTNKEIFLTSIIKQFRCFIWTRKIQEKSKCKQLLKEGLQLFDPQTNTPVLQYIYNELIMLEEERVQKLKKLKNFCEVELDNNQAHISSKMIEEPSLIKFANNIFQHEIAQKIVMLAQLKIHRNIISSLQLNKNRRQVRFTRQTNSYQNVGCIGKNMLFSSNDNKIIQQQQESSHEINSKQHKQTSKLSENKNFFRTNRLISHPSSNEDLPNYKGQDQQLDKNSEQSMDLRIDGQTLENLNEQIFYAYKTICLYYQTLFQIKKGYLDRNKQLLQEKKQSYKLYQLEMLRLKYLCKTYKYQKQNDVNFDPDDYISELQNVAAFQQFADDIDPVLLEKAALYKIKLAKILEYPISYRQLEELCNSQDDDIKMEARHILAQEFTKRRPHFDLEVVNRALQNLTQTATKANYKRKVLKSLKNILASKASFQQEIEDITMISHFYNYSNKKFYFVVDFSQIYDLFTPCLHAIYYFMNALDLMKIYNLANYDASESSIKHQQMIKPKYWSHFQHLFEQLNFENSRLKSKASNKNIQKKIMCEKDFENILSKIAENKTQFSKFIVVILGGDGGGGASLVSDQNESGASQHYSHKQMHHNPIEIIRILEKNNFHIILIGQNLNSYQTRQGRLKKYSKQSYDVLQLDIAKKNPLLISQQIQKYLTK